MFEQSLIDGLNDGVKPWTFAVSLALQCALLALAILTPLIFTYELPVTEWLEHTLLVAPPPAAPPQAPQARAAPKPPPPDRFDAFVAPNKIPDNIALLQDAEALTDSIDAPDLGAMQGGVSGGLEGGVLGAMAGSLYVPEMPLRVGGRVQSAKILSRVNPVYPAEALDQGLSGSVRLEAIITVQGLVRDIKVLQGDPVLAAAAVEAVQQWRYEPTFLNGRAVEVVTSVDVRFAITAPPEPPAKDERGRNNRRRKR